MKTSMPSFKVKYHPCAVRRVVTVAGWLIMTALDWVQLDALGPLSAEEITRLEADEALALNFLSASSIEGASPRPNRQWSYTAPSVTE